MSFHIKYPSKGSDDVLGFTTIGCKTIISILFRSITRMGIKSFLSISAQTQIKKISFPFYSVFLVEPNLNIFVFSYLFNRQIQALLLYFQYFLTSIMKHNIRSFDQHAFSLAITHIDLFMHYTNYIYSPHISHKIHLCYLFYVSHFACVNAFLLPQLATNTLERVAPLTHAVGNVLKRVFVIGFSIIIFGMHSYTPIYMFNYCTLIFFLSPCLYTYCTSF